MKNKEERKQRFSLTLLFSAIVIVIFVAVLLVVGLVLGILTQLGVLVTAENGAIPTSHLLLIFIAASLVVGSGMTLLLSRIPLRPVNGLLDIMKKLASGDFTPRIQLPKPWDKNPSMAELADSFNKMAQELQSTEMLRSDFINDFSHEFKTPIVSIAGFAKLLKKEKLTETQQEYVRIIEEESLRLSQMATNVLNLNKLESQSILSDVSTYNLSEQLRSCILLLSSKWEEKDIEFELDFREVSISGSEELLMQVWINLLDNAIKFSPEASVVGVNIENGTDFVEVHIENHGPEISPEEQKKIFGKFYQSDQSRATQGNGIGLAVVKRVAQLHEGSVSVTSGEGLTVFSVRLPKRLC